MIYYSPEDSAFEKIKDELKPTICKSCYADGDRTYGHCEQCLKNQAYNKEYCETHLYTVGTWLGDYHTGGSYHTMKYVPYRKNNEHPYLYYGFELEVGFDTDQMRVNYYNEEYDEESDSDISSDCQEMLEEFEKATQGLFASKERDGSVYNGIEFVSRPMPYSTIIDPDTIEKLEKGLEVLKNWGAFEDQPYKHGMHVHISRKFFDFDENGTRVCDARDKAYQDMDWLFQFYQPELEKIAGREYYTYCEGKMAKLKSQYHILDGMRNDGLWKVKLEGKMVKGGDMACDDHHSAITLSGKTIEGRIFKSTLDINHIIGNIEVMRNFAHAVRGSEIVGKTLNDILHTKDNLYLDKVLDEIRKQAFKTKTEFNLDKVVEEEMEIK